MIIICRKCKRNASINWWKCCSEHVTDNGPDVYCDACVQLLHPKDPRFKRIDLPE